jgi:microcystin-dependent protein
MAEPFLSELRLMSFVFAPKGWALCNGQLLPINQNQPLFALLGTTYGGNGQTNFALPNLRGRAPMHAGNGHTLGEAGGEESHTLKLGEMPTHNHLANATSLDANQPGAGGAYLAGANNAYAVFGSITTLDPSSVTNTGGSQAHENRGPALVLSWCIALQGIFPSPN